MHKFCWKKMLLSDTFDRSKTAYFLLLFVFNSSDKKCTWYYTCVVPVELQLFRKILFKVNWIIRSKMLGLCWNLKPWNRKYHQSSPQRKSKFWGNKETTPWRQSNYLDFMCLFVVFVFFLFKISSLQVLLLFTNITFQLIFVNFLLYCEKSLK